MKFGQLILRKITKIIATRCPILRLKCTKFVFGWGSAPDSLEEHTMIRALPQISSSWAASRQRGVREGTEKGRGEGGEEGEEVRESNRDVG